MKYTKLKIKNDRKIEWERGRERETLTIAEDPKGKAELEMA